MIDKDVIREKLCQATYERNLLTFALNGRDNYYDILSKISGSDFLHHKHAVIFDTLTVLHGKGVKEFALDIVLNELEKNGDLHNVGGASYVRVIKDHEISKSNLEKSIDAVLDASTKFGLYTKLCGHVDSIVENADDGALTGNDLIGKVEGDILSLSVESASISEPRNLADGMKEYIEEKMENPKKMSGISTGYVILDRQIDGLVPNTLTVVAARKKMGKSAFLTNMATHIAYVQNLPVLYIDTEMSFNEWRDRMIAGMTGIREREIKHGGYSDQQYKLIVEKCIKICEKGRLFHENMPGYSIDKITALYKKYKFKEDIGVGIFDYIKEPENDGKDRKEYQLLGDVTTRLKDLANQLSIPFITAVQLNRSNDIADSDRIARYADITMFWEQRKDDEIDRSSHGGHKMVIKDSRRGGSTTEEGIAYYFNKECLRIREVPVDRQLMQYTSGVVNAGSSVSGGDDDLF